MSINVGKRHQFCLALAALAVAAALCITGCEGLLEETSTEVGSMTGYVVDNEGRALSGATARTDDGESAQTNAGGRFEIEDVRVGTRTVTASMAGYFNAGEGQAQRNVVADTQSDAGTLRLVPLGDTDGVEHIWLKDLEPTTTENWYVHDGQFQINGQTFLDDLYYTVWGNGALGMARYNIGRKYKRFKATAGVLDSNASTTDQVIFIVRGDNVELFRSAPVHTGTPVLIDVDVSSVLTLDIMSTIDTTTTEASVYVGFGNAILTVE